MTWLIKSKQDNISYETDNLDFFMGIISCMPDEFTISCEKMNVEITIKVTETNA